MWKSIARWLHQRVADARLLNGRPVKLVDGSTVSMPDTAGNQAEYPRSSSWAAGKQPFVCQPWFVMQKRPIEVIGRHLNQAHFVPNFQSPPAANQR